MQHVLPDLTVTPSGTLRDDLTAALRIKDGSSRNGGLGQEGKQHHSFYLVAFAERWVKPGRTAARSGH